MGATKFLPELGNVCSDLRTYSISHDGKHYIAWLSSGWGSRGSPVTGKSWSRTRKRYHLIIYTSTNLPKSIAIWNKKHNTTLFRALERNRFNNTEFIRRYLISETNEKTTNINTEHESLFPISHQYLTTERDLENRLNVIRWIPRIHVLSNSRNSYHGKKSRVEFGMAAVASVIPAFTGNSSSSDRPAGKGPCPTLIPADQYAHR